MKVFLALIISIVAIAGRASEASEIISKNITFEAAPVYRKIPVYFQYDPALLKPGTAAVLTFQARYSVKENAPIKKYYYPGRPREILCLRLNNVPLTDNERVVPKQRFIRTNTTAYDVCNPYTNAWNLLNSDSFDESPELRCNVPYAKPFDYALEVTGLLKKGKNVLNLIPFPPAGGGQNYYTIELRNIALVIMPEAKVKKGRSVKAGTVPEGRLTVYEPVNTERVDYTFDIDKYGGITIQVNQEKYHVQSLWFWPKKGMNILGLGRGSSAEKSWQPQIEKISEKEVKITAFGKYYKLVRTLKAYDDHLDIFDEFENLQDTDTPIVGRTSILSRGKCREVYAAGVQRVKAQGTVGFTPQNPTIYLEQSKSGLGMMAREDIMRSSVNLFWNKDAGMPVAGFELWHHVLPPRGRCTLQWTIVPTGVADYWQFVNSIRRIMNVNFTIPGLAVFASIRHPLSKMSAEEIRSYIKNRGIKLILTDHYRKPDPKNPDKSKPVQGADALNDYVQNSRQQFSKLIKKIKEAAPEVKVLVYFHSALCSDPDAFNKYAGCRGLLNGKGVSSYPDMILLFPTLTNSYGQALFKVLDMDTGEVGADGVYWDEMCTGYVGDADKWSGRHAIVSRADYTAGKRYSFTPHLAIPWRKAAVEKLHKRGLSVIANTNPTTDTMAKLHFPRFVEYNNYDSCADTQLYTPITVTQAERSNSSENILKQAREYLEHGSLTYELAPYNQGPAASVGINYDNLLSNMYPFTPIYIQPGVMIGKERILISRPGIFGWGDGTLPGQVKVFDENGRLIDGSAWVTEDKNKGLTAVRLPVGYTAVLLRSDKK